MQTTEVGQWAALALTAENFVHLPRIASGFIGHKSPASDHVPMLVGVFARLSRHVVPIPILPKHPNPGSGNTFELHHPSTYIALNHLPGRASDAGKDDSHLGGSIRVDLHAANHSHLSERHIEVGVRHSLEGFANICFGYHSWSPHSSRRKRS